jgi:hypothetical protein
MASEAAPVDEDDQTWRCKACGAVQRDPDPPCESCWNTTFVAGDGGEAASGPDGIASLSNTPVSTADATAARVQHVKSATTRTTTATVLAAGGIFAANALLPVGGLLDTVLHWGTLGLGALAALLVVLTAGVYVADAADRRIES